MSGMTRRDFIGTLGTAAAGAVSAGKLTPVHGEAAGRPNILFILADDLGYGDLSGYGRPDYQTPVLDRLARGGLKFTSAYAAAPVCTPTRCAFVTGRYPQRLSVGLEEPLKATSGRCSGAPRRGRRPASANGSICTTARRGCSICRAISARRPISRISEAKYSSSSVVNTRRGRHKCYRGRRNAHLLACGSSNCRPTSRNRFKTWCRSSSRRRLHRRTHDWKNECSGANTLSPECEWRVPGFRLRT